MGHLVTLATCNLNQWALDWEGNTNRIIQSIKQAKAAGAKLRVGPELEICGYGCLDHFLEQDLYLHSWECLERILADEECHGILCDIGMPVAHKNVRYNCRVIVLNGKILFIRPKLSLANDGNYREMRFFTAWPPLKVDEYHLPRRIQKLQGATHVTFGDAVVSTPDTCFGAETCEELWTPDAPHNHMTLDGVEIVTNSSGSHFNLRKLNERVDLIRDATKRCGGVYLYANQKGADGDRLYYDGCAMIAMNGKVLAQASQFSLLDVEVVTATIDLEEVRAHRFAPSRGMQAVAAPRYQRVQTDFALSADVEDMSRYPSPQIKIRYHSPEEEIALATSCYLWDYLRRCGVAGYLVPLSGGIDSCATATMIFGMCRMVIEGVSDGNEQVIKDVKRIARYSEDLPKTAQELCNQLFHTIYMGMSQQSSKETRQRAIDLAEAIGSYHVDLDIDTVYNAQKGLITSALNFTPKFKVEGGSVTENLTLQNIQARTRMVTAYEFAQILPVARERPTGGSLLVLGSANVGESLRGYLTKYDCSSADINPIGSIDKSDLKRYIAWAEKKYGIPCLREFLDAVPTAELEPITADYVQSDEVDMGMTYAELTVFGRLRKESKLGPYGMFQRLVHEWGPNGTLQHTDDDETDLNTRKVYSPREVADKVKKFFHFYAINRHKMTTLTPSLHCNGYSPDDNRFDLRPFLYPSFWSSHSFKRIDEELERIEGILGKQDSSSVAKAS